MNLITQKPKAGQALGKYKSAYIENIIKPSPIEINAVLPRDIQAEDNILSHCLSNGDATDCAMRICYAEDFSRNGTEAIFARLVNFRKAGRSYTLDTILKSFEDREDSKLFTDFIYNLGPFWHLSDMGPIRHYARIVREFGVRRRLLLGCVSVASELFDVSTNVNELADRAKKLGAVSAFRLKKAEVTNAT